MSISIAFVTCPNSEVANSLAKKAVELRLAACVNLLSNVTSVYRWQGNVEQSYECLMMIKTSPDQLKDLEEFILREHPYDVPEFVCINSEQVAADYEKWVLGETL